MENQTQADSGQLNNDTAAGEVNGIPNNETQGAADGQAKPDEGNANANTQDGQGDQGNQGQDDKQGEGKDGEGEGDGKQEEVQYTFELPEGFNLDEEIGNELAALAKEKNLSNEEAQKFIDLGVKMKQREAEAFERIQNEWVEQIKADPVIGGEKLGENVAVAKKAIDAFGTPELKSLLDKSRFGNHPEVVKFAYNIGKAMSEDKLVIGQGKPRGAPSDPAKTMFPNQN